MRKERESKKRNPPIDSTSESIFSRSLEVPQGQNPPSPHDMRNRSMEVVVALAVVVGLVTEGGGRWRQRAPFEDWVASLADVGAWSGSGERVFQPAHY
jgi:hypothetical protein